MDDDDRDPWLSWVPMTLYLCGALYALLGLVSGVGFLGIGGMVLQDPNSTDGPIVAAMMAVYAVVAGGMLFAWAALNFAGGWGFAQRARWGWFVALILGGIYAPSMCFPLGLVLLYGCLNDRTRTTFIG